MKKKLFTEIPYIVGKNIVLKRIGTDDAEGLQELVDNPAVYRYLPTFLFEKKYPDVRKVIAHLYTECFRESIITGIYLDEGFCGLAELYGYRDPLHKVSVGYRLIERYWGKGIASEALAALVSYLYRETDIEIITASTMAENKASAEVLIKNGFDLVTRSAYEDWGYDQPTLTDKWIR